MSLPKLNYKASSTWNIPIEDVDSYLVSFPPGYHFKPKDKELIVNYLRPKLFNKPLPPNKIRDVDLYQFNPEALAGDKNGTYGEGEWYFFTPRDKKYKNGSRPRRAAGDGYWKATGADRTIESKGVEVGYRKALVFYKGKPPKGDKTNWMMHEYRLKDPPARLKPPPDSNDMRLDDWVLCKIYKKSDKYIKAAKREQEQQEPEEQEQVQGFGEENHEDGELLDNANTGFLPYHQQQLQEFTNFDFESDVEQYFVDHNMMNEYYYDHYDNSSVPNVYDVNFVPEVFGLPSAMAPPMPPMDTVDQYLNDVPDEKLPHFKFDHHYYP